MKFSKQELTLLMDALTAVLDKFESELAEQESILFDGIERGEDTEETEGYISLLDENIRVHQNLLDKLEALREGSYY